MGSLQRFLDRFGPSSEAESVWLQNLFTFIHRHLRTPRGPAHSTGDPAHSTGGPAHSARGHTYSAAASQSAAGASCDQGVCELSVCVVEKIQERSSLKSSRPVSYRPLCVSELLAQQHLACVSNLSWSTNQHRAWAREAELSLPGQRSLPRVNLLLIGWLRAGRDGEWRLEDDSGSVSCEMTSPSPQWMNHLIFLPHWNYIPHDASGRDQERGYLELIGSPDLLGPKAELGLAAGPGGAGPNEGAGPDVALSVREAAGVLRNRVKGHRVSVWGQVGSVRPLLEVSGSCFFFFCLEDQQQTVPVLVKGSRLWWAQCVCVGVTVCVTALRVCVLRGWRGNSVLCVTNRSEIHTGYTPGHTHSEATHTQEHTHPEPPLLCAAGPAHSDQLLMDKEEAELEELPVQSGGRIKSSRVISYQGTVTEVVSEGAGLYLLDRKVGLCLAYQPPARRKLRPGDQVELHQVHFLFRPSPDFPPSMLCCCLGSSLRVSAFSRVGGASREPGCPGDGVLPRLLLQSIRGVDQYLWTCSLASQLAHSLVPSDPPRSPLHPPLPHCVCLLSWKLSETLWTQRGQRDIYSEMLDRPHRCPLDQYQVDPFVPQLLSVSDVLQSLRSSCWSSLLPPGVLSSSQVNSALSWSCRTLTSDPRTGDSLRPRPLLLVGVLQLPSERSEFTQNLELRDATAAVSCVVTETTEENGGQRSAFNTAWIGSLVCVRSFTMVTERFLQSEFGHLDQNSFISNRTCRVYLQFSLDDLIILSPSVTMATHMRMRGTEPGSDDLHRNQREEEEGDDEGSCLKKRRCDEEHSSSVAMVTAHEGGESPRPCVSIVIRVESKGGVAWRNAVIGGGNEGAGLQLGFSATALLIGPVVSWGRDPKNQPMMEKEAEPEREEKVLLQFSGVSSRWFPLLQPGSVYRLTAPNTQDPSVLIGCSVAGQKGVGLHADSSLQVRPDWRIHTLTRPLLLPHTWTQAPPPPILSVSQVLDCRSEVVTFQGRVTERVSLMDRRRRASGVRLTVCDQSGRSLCVYLDLSHAPYPPGLLPGNQVLLSGFLRKISRSGGVYCCLSPVGCVTVTSLGDSSRLAPPPAPSMHLAHLACSTTVEAQVKGHVVCVLNLQLQWSCSHQGAQYTQVCSSHCGSAAFQATARLVIDDGTAEAHVWLSGQPLQAVLGLADSQWAGLQRAVRVRGHVLVFPGGRSLRTDGDTEDVLLNFLLSLCSGDVIGRQVTLICRKRTNQSSAEARRFSRGDRDFLTRRLRPLQLTCSHLELQEES